jgi:Putative metal-binding motif
MASKAWRYGLAGCLATIPFIQFACGSAKDRVYSNGDASLGGTTGTGATGGTGGAAGGAQGGASGTGATGGSSGTGGIAGSGGQAGADGGTPCTSATDCDDQEPCNGTETCSGGFCKSGTSLADGTGCAAADAGTSDAGTQKACFSGTCIDKCTQDSDCDDGDVCTGVETCGPSKVCQTGTPMTCDDSDACTTNSCDPITGCYYPLIDQDGDGHAATSLGSCGDDCDDTDPSIYSGAQELCDSKDNNCNGQTDELAPTWYVDCDSDGFAPAGAANLAQCTKPATPDSSCGATGSWTSTAPAAGTTDCWDKDAKAHPYTASGNGSAWQTTPITGAPTTVDFDYNCDGVEEKQITSVNVSSTNFCLITFCGGASGWTGSVAPACGQSAQYTYCSLSKGGGCARVTTTKAQPCR